MRRRTLLSTLSVLPLGAAGPAAAEPLGDRATAANRTTDDPTITTRAPIDVRDREVDPVAAWLRGEAPDDEDAYDELGVEYWERGRKDETVETKTIPPGSTGGEPEDVFQTVVTGLAYETTYVYRAFVKGSGWFDSRTYAEPFAFTTPPEDADSPTVETLEPSDVTTSEATLRGRLEDLGEYDEAWLYFRYESPLSDVPTRVERVEARATEPTTFELAVDGLSPRPLDHDVAALALPGDVDGLVEDTSGELEFETDDPAPITLETRSATDVGSTTATFRGDVLEFGDFAPTGLQFAYWERGRKDATSETVAADPPFLVEPGSVAASVEDLSPGTTYVVELTTSEDDVAVATTQVEVTTDASDGRSADADEPAVADAEDTGASIAEDLEFESADGVGWLSLFGPDPETREPTEVDATGARLRGYIDTGPDEYRKIGFEYWKKGEREPDGAPNELVEVEPPAEPGEYEARVEELEPETTYVARATVVEGWFGLIPDRESGETVEFTTSTEDDGGQPVVSVEDPVNLRPTDALLQTTLYSLGGLDSVRVFAWCRRESRLRRYASSAEATLFDPDVTAPDTFELSVEGLEPDTKYEYGIEAYGVDDGRLVAVESGVREFTTPDAPRRTISTLPAADVEATTARVRGRIGDGSTEDGADTQVRWRQPFSTPGEWARPKLVYWPVDDPESVRRVATPAPPLLTDPGEFSATLEGLEPDTTYRFEAVDSVTLDDGGVREFTTGGD